MTLSASLTATFSAAQVATSTLGRTEAQSRVLDESMFTIGTGASQANLVYVGTRTVASGANDDLDLNGTSLQTLLGANIAATSLVGIMIVNRPASPAAAPNTTSLTLGGGTNPVVGYMGGTTPTIIIKPNMTVFMECGSAGGICAVTAATGDILRIANASGAANTYQIALLMRG